MTKHRLTSEQFLPLMLSAAGAIGVLPLAVVRLLERDWLIAFFDLGIVASLSFLGLYVMRTRRVRLASVSLAVICAVGAVVTVYLKGPAQIFWSFPVVLALFFLVTAREAVIACALMIAGLVPLLFGQMQDITLTSFLITLLVTIAFAYAFSILTSEQRDQLVHLATRDPLTGAGNRRALGERLAEIIALHARVPVTSSMVVLDLDHFKRINDEHGHDVGDEILVAVTRLIENRIRITDRLYRVGGEEFVILAEGDDLDMATALAEDLRVLIEGNSLDARCDVTVSLGVAQLAHGESDKDWFRRADLALYEAKNGGRNRVAIAQ